MVPSPSQPIRANPLLSTYKTQFILFVVGIVLLLLNPIQIMITDLFRLQSHGGNVARFLAVWLPLLYLLLSALVNIVFSFSQWRYWQRIEQRRIAVVMGDRSLLAAEQPVVDAFALPLPCTFTLGYNLRSLAQFAGIILIVAIIYFGPLSWGMNMTGLSDRMTVSDPMLIGVIIIIACALAALGFFLLRRRRHVVEISEVGISMNMDGKMSFVRWQDARLFAVYHTWGAQRNQSSLTYELSSMTDIVRWTEIVRPSSFITLPQMMPTIPLPQYQQQVQALNSLVAGRIGLPLCDLRKERALDAALRQQAYIGNRRGH